VARRRIRATARGALATLGTVTSFPFRTALVTGASSGIGETMAIHLAGAGVQVVAVARRGDRLDALAATHPNIEAMVAGLTEPDALRQVVERIEDRRHPIDLVVNNAGFGTNGRFHTLDGQRLEREISLNVTALTEISRAALAQMVPRGRGWLLNVSSVASFQPAPKLAVYAATKAYVTSLTESLHEEVRGCGVHVTVLCPGLTKTEFQSVSNTASYADSFPDAAWTSPESVVTAGLAAVVANRTIAVPGRQYRLMSAVVNVTPRWLRRRASSLVQRG
jgi:short-subunit dehydrogenase